MRRLDVHVFPFSINSAHVVFREILTFIDVTERTTTYFLDHFVFVVHDDVESISEVMHGKKYYRVKEKKRILTHSWLPDVREITQ